MNHIIEYIKQKYDPCSIILYGSYADGTNNLNSDFDALVLSYNYDQFHDTSFVNGVQLDLFVYPVSYFDEAYDCNDFIQIFDGRIIMDSNDRGKTLQAKVLSYLQDQPQKPREEIAAGVDWCYGWNVCASPNGRRRERPDGRLETLWLSSRHHYLVEKSGEWMKEASNAFLCGAREVRREGETGSHR